MENLINKLEKINEDFYKNIENIYMANFKLGYAKSTGYKILKICTDMDIMIGKFRYNLNLDPEKIHIEGYEIEDLERYIEQMLETIEKFKKTHDLSENILPKIVDLKVEYEKKLRDDAPYFDDDIECSDDKSISIGFLKNQLIEKIKDKLENFLKSKNSNIIEKIEDGLYHNNLDNVLKKYKIGVNRAKRYMLAVRKYQYIVDMKTVDIEDLYNFETNVDDCVNIK